MIAGNSPACLITTYGWLLDFNQSDHDGYILQFAEFGGGNERSIAMAGGFLYVLRPQVRKLLYCFDISDESNPVQVSMLSKNCFLVGGTDHHLFTWEAPSYGRSQLCAYEVGEEGALRQVGVLAEPDIRADWKYYQGKIYDGYMLCEASSFNGFVAIDIRNPAQMRKINLPATHDFDDWAYDSERHILYARTNDWEDQAFDDGIMRLDVSDLAHPVDLDRVLIGPRYYSLNYDNKRLYMLERIGTEDSMRVANVEDQDNIQIIASYKPEHLSRLVMVKDNRLFFTTREEGQPAILHIWDVSDLEAPIEIGLGEAEGCHLQPILQDGLLISNNIYSVDFYDVSRALDVRDQSPVSLQPSTFSLSAFPNPFNSSVTITFSTGRDARPKRLAIYDLSGRMVADLLQSHPPFSSPPASRGGKQTVVWDVGGIPAGVYFVRMDSGSNRIIQKICLIR